MNTSQYLEHIIKVISKSGNPDKPFFYLGGPMSGIPQYNFPRFKEVAETLRNNSYNIISPAELDDPEAEAAALASEDGGLDPDYDKYLRRDFVIVSLPTCVGGIFLENWHHSRGARGETWTLEFFNRQLLEYHEDGEQGLPQLRAFRRDERLRELGVDAEGVPLDIPGERTAAALAPQSNAGAVMHSVLSRSEREGEERHDRLMWGDAI